MLTPQEIVLQYVCPGLGCVVALLLFSSPLPAVRRVNSTKQLGDLNVLPFAMMVANCISWVLYGFLLTDWFIYVGNIPGVLLGLYYVLTCYKYSKESAQDAIIYLLLAVVMLFCTIGIVHMAAIRSLPAAKTLWGSTCVAVLACYYSAPLTTLYRVVTTRNSSSLHWPLCLMNTINGGLWFAYGLAIKDWFVCVPNGIGAAFNLVCIILCLVFPRTSGGEDGSSAEGGNALTRHHLGRNWSLLRLQSKRTPAADAAVAAAAVDQVPDLDKTEAALNGHSIPVTAAAGRGQPARGHSFLDVSRMRWRSGEEALPGVGGSSSADQQQQQQQSRHLLPQQQLQLGLADTDRV